MPGLSDKDKEVIRQLKRSLGDLRRNMTTAGIFEELDQALNAALDGARDLAKHLAEEEYELLGMSPPAVEYDEISDVMWDLAIEAVGGYLKDWIKPIGGVPAGYK